MPSLLPPADDRRRLKSFDGRHTCGAGGMYPEARRQAGKPTLTHSSSDSRLQSRDRSARGPTGLARMSARDVMRSDGFDRSQRSDSSHARSDLLAERGLDRRRAEPVPEVSMARRVGSDTIGQRGKGYLGNQDRFAHVLDDARLLTGVFDGHGQHGDKVADLAKDSLPREVFSRARRISADDKPGALERAMSQAFEATQQDLMGQRHVSSYSGTTAVAAYFPDQSNIVVANCGDSRAVLGRRVGGRVQAVDLSSDHTPCRPDERKRIEALQGRVHQTMVPVMRQTTMGGSERGVVGMGPQRVWDKHGTCGLGVSRSLGDLHMHPFVSGSPEIVSRKLDAEDKVVVLGSDGVWNHMTSQEAVEVASKHSCPKKAAKAITQVAHQRWINETGGRVSDDITAVVVKLEADGGVPRRESRPSSDVSRRR